MDGSVYLSGLSAGQNLRQVIYMISQSVRDSHKNSSFISSEILFSDSSLLDSFFHEWHIPVLDEDPTAPLLLYENYTPFLYQLKVYPCKAEKLLVLMVFLWKKKTLSSHNVQPTR